MHGKVLENFQLTICSLAAEDNSLALKVLRHDHDLTEIEHRYREAHLRRLQKRMKESLETSPLHLDLLSHLRGINTKLAAIARLSMMEHPAVS